MAWSEESLSEDSWTDETMPQALYLTDDDGNYLIDDEGNYIVVSAASDWKAESLPTT